MSTWIYKRGDEKPITCILVGRLRHVDSTTYLPSNAVEGIDWIHGHHRFDSMEVAALVAAWKLRGPLVIELEEASDLYTKGRITEAEWKTNLDLFDVEFVAGRWS